MQHICFLHKLHNFPCIFLDVAFLVSKMWFRIWSTSPSDFVCVAKWSLKEWCSNVKANPKLKDKSFCWGKRISSYFEGDKTCSIFFDKIDGTLSRRNLLPPSNYFKFVLYISDNEVLYRRRCDRGVSKVRYFAFTFFS